MTKREIKNFLKAKSLTELSDFNKIHIGCVAVLKSKVIGVGYNTYKTHPKQKHFDSYRELTVNGAVDKFKKRFSVTTAYGTRLNYTYIEKKLLNLLD